MSEIEKPKFDIEDIESKEIPKYGRNVYQRATYVRHGDKAGEMLSPKGRKQAQEFGQTLELKDVDVVKPYGGNLERARETAKIAVEAAMHEKKLPLREKYGLGPGEAWDDEFKNMINQKMTEFNGNLDKVLQWEIDQWGKKSGQWAPEEIGINFANRVLWQCKMPERYKFGSKVQLISGTHTGVMELGLKFLIGDQIEEDPINPNGNDFIEKIGGGFGFTESFDVVTKIDEKGVKTATLVLARKGFAPKEYTLNLDKIRTKIDEYNQTKDSY